MLLPGFVSRPCPSGHHETRHHWHIENCLHWAVDIGFHKDECRANGHPAKTMAPQLCHLAPLGAQPLKQEQTRKLGIKNKRLEAGRDVSYLLRVLQPLFV
jgi:hypothetical protein